MAMKAHSRPRGFFAPLFALLVIICLWPGPAVLARPVYQIKDSTEGDPGDGVLHPQPEIFDPAPVPAPRTQGGIFTLGIPSYDRPHQPVLILPIFYFGRIIPVGLDLNQITILLPEGRWHDAP